MSEKEELSKFYNCSECSSLIEILSINEENNTIEFKCLNKGINIELSIEDYLKNMVNYTPKKINHEICNIHKENYMSYCFDCNSNICKECLKSRNHIHHYKNNIIEIQPSLEELKVYSKIIEYYNNEIQKLKNENIKKIKKLEEKYNNIKIKYNNIKEKKIIINKDKEKKELNKIKELYRYDIEQIKKK